MPTIDQHQQRADHYLAFLETIDPDEFCDCMALAAFYVAVHLVERLRAFADEHSKDHGERLAFVQHDHPAIWPNYDRLFEISLLVRYQSGPFHWLLPEHVRGHLEVIQHYVRDYTPPA